MADVKVRHRVTGDIVEMSEYGFELARHEYELVPVIPGKRPVIETIQEPEEQLEKLPETEPVKEAKTKKKKAQ